MMMYAPPVMTTDTPPPAEFYTVPVIDPHYHFPSTEKPPQPHEFKPSCCERGLSVTANLVVILVFLTLFGALVYNWRALSTTAENAQNISGDVAVKMPVFMDMATNMNKLTSGFRNVNSTEMALNIEDSSRLSVQLLRSFFKNRQISFTVQMPFGGEIDENGNNNNGTDSNGDDPPASPRNGRPRPRDPLPM